MCNIISVGIYAKMASWNLDLALMFFFLLISLQLWSVKATFLFSNVNHVWVISYVCVMFLRLDVPHNFPYTISNHDLYYYCYYWECPCLEQLLVPANKTTQSTHVVISNNEYGGHEAIWALSRQFFVTTWHSETSPTIPITRIINTRQQCMLHSAIHLSYVVVASREIIMLHSLGEHKR